MSTHRTSEEAKLNCIEVMGPELGPLYHGLWNELAWLHSNWKEYVLLFGTKPSRIELLNKSASHFFNVVQHTLWNDTLLHIARLTDKKTIAGKNNLTIKKLPDLIADLTLLDQLTNLINIADDKSAFCRDWRNRKIAHKDFDLYMRNGSKPLKPASRAKIKTAIHSVADVLDAVSSHYLNTTTYFEGIDEPGGAVSLLYILDDGLRADRERQERYKAGNFTSDDQLARNI